MSKKYLCVHGHFYQPPREDPFTGIIPSEHGAKPFRNFNEKITAECYRPNAYANNFAHISFDLGPTLASWLEKAHPDVLRKIVASENEHYSRYKVSNTLAQPYNHTILPLGNDRDRWTQIKWGIADFEARFGRKPHGMWLPETAVDLRTLAILEQCGMTYTILAPWQAKWNVDVTQPYKVWLPGGRTLTVFFYDAGLSGHTSFQDHETTNADTFVAKYLARKQGLTLIATDGELYGHHKAFCDHFLSHLVKNAAPHQGIEVITLERYIKLHPPTQEMEIHDQSSWSCFCGGLARWDTGCGCPESGGKASWKPALRRALDTLSQRAYQQFEEETRPALPAMWLARDDYVALRHGLITEDAFWRKHGKDARKPDNRGLVWKTRLLLEAQYYLQQSFTSCAWYWGSANRIDGFNTIKFATRGIDLIRRATGVNFSPDFLRDLQQIQEYRTPFWRGATFSLAAWEHIFHCMVRSFLKGLGSIKSKIGSERRRKVQ